MKQYQHYYDIDPNEAYFWDWDDPFELWGEAFDNFRCLIGYDIILHRFNSGEYYPLDAERIQCGGNWSRQWESFWVSKADFTRLQRRAGAEGLPLREYLDICYYLALGKL